MEVKPFDEDAEYDRAKEVKEFDETKSGVKGLFDSTILKLPRFFIHSPQSLSFPPTTTTTFQVPVIDFTGYDESYRRQEIICQISKASETMGFFQMVNHGVPVCVMDDMLRVIKEFHELPKEVKKEWYSRDHDVKVRYFSNGDLFVAKAANWRDTIAFDFQNGPLNPQDYPLVCRDAVSKYINDIMKLREILSELLSEVLGLRKEYLGSIECMKSETMVCHYYPACPEPNLTFGSTKHSDPSSLTILLQDTIGGLQVFHQNHWIDVNPVQGALVVNIGDFMQLISNDKFKSVEHRVLCGSVGPRVSAACHIYPSQSHKYKPYGPIEELTSNQNPPKYRATHNAEYLAYYRSKGLDGNKALPYFRL
ncbi:hypothetical protein Lal_00037578 [Lupinus albus]|uniref:Putative oxoglutarate/iron-dependent dioxygenase, non-hem dioxygenase domain-containing protein n=1 Tax=Lupinus albus TaxID=3870 RepID=A0A6A4NTH1_LUPAL|nr:putative oxoglutarate/iron-dependent dioxygenase, non-hem dioxygenase domain-containing protein [Lupinus albus]KAF1860240.1 hypothetical protein Lal_00037578 [Lupinus albus]